MNTTDIEISFQSTPRLWMACREGTDFAEDSRPTYGLGKTPLEALAHLIEQELDAEEFPRPHRHPGPVAGCPECIKESKSLR